MPSVRAHLVPLTRTLRVLRERDMPCAPAAGRFHVPKTAKTKMEVCAEMQDNLHLCIHFPNLATRRAALAGERSRESGCGVRRRHLSHGSRPFWGDLRLMKHGLGVWGCLHPHHCLKSRLSRFRGHLARRARPSGRGPLRAATPGRFCGRGRVSAVAESRLWASNRTYIDLRQKKQRLKPQVKGHFLPSIFSICF